MKKVLRFLVCCVISFVVMILSGHGELLYAVSEPMAIGIMLRAMLLVAVALFVALEVYLSFRQKISALSERIDALEHPSDKKE